MSDKKTLLVIVSDRSGSMQTGREEYQHAINKLLSDQKSGDGDCFVTLVQFDTEYEVVHKYVDVKNVGEYKLEPRFGTALFDAVGKTIHDVKAMLAGMAPEEKPGFVNFVICTDGYNNASVEHTVQTVKSLIDEQKKNDWVFTFLGVDINADQYGKDFGIQNVVNVTRAKAGDALAMFSGKMGTSRSAYAAGESVAECSAHMLYTEEEKKELE